MARLPRLTLAGQPHHIVQRGNNRQAIAQDDADRHMLLTLLERHAKAQLVDIHAYVLMDNHFHLLATPKTPEGVPRLMQAVGRAYVRHFNDRHGRTGTLWEGRYRSTLIQPERYLLACMAYIDLNPVRAGLCAGAQDYAWSSHAHYAGRATRQLVVSHPLYWALGNTPFAREAAYMGLVSEGVPSTLERALTNSVLKGWALGDPAYFEALQAAGARRVVQAPRGRPPRGGNVSPNASSIRSRS